ncbi:MAG TPA: tetratricopeptide repeat protein [Bradyrhizobium sp.]|nr:tetratricopeptide repeat protein [Bradyrhizobium sp.]
MNHRDRQAAAGQSPSASDAGSDAGALCAAGFRHFEAGRVLDAQLCCRQALGLDPHHADTMHLLGLLSAQAAQHELALEWLSRAIRQEARPRYLSSLGNLLRRQGRHDEALRAFDKAVQLDPAAPEPWRDLAALLMELKRFDQALLALGQLQARAPEDWDAAMKRASVLLQLNRTEEAIVSLDQCDRLRPDHAPTLQVRALAQHSLDRLEPALADLTKAHALDPDNASICNDIGVFLRLLGRGEESIAWFDAALARKADYFAAYNNKAFALTHLHRFAEAFATYDALKAIDPGNVEAIWSEALLQLLTGNFAAGWRGREARFRVPGLPVINYNFAQPLWLGESSLEGKTILIHADEGIGDTLQFARYVPDVAARGARVVLLLPESLCPLLARLPGVVECVPMTGNKVIAFDTYCPISSLPLAFATTLHSIPGATPYLPAPEPAQVQAWDARLTLHEKLPHDRLRIGLTWSGNPSHKDDRNRSLPLRALAPLFDCDATFVSLQKDPRPADKEVLRERPEIVDLSAHLTDFGATAALLSCLDLVITVDTSVAHLAGALARPVWILLPYTPDYRWLLDRDDSPWYPSARLYRQDASRDYAGVIARVRAELQATIAARSRERPRPDSATK